jgi:hypothetical protein
MYIYWNKYWICKWKRNHLPAYPNNYESRDSNGVDLRPPNIKTTDTLNSSGGGYCKLWYFINFQYSISIILDQYLPPGGEHNRWIEYHNSVWVSLGVDAALLGNRDFDFWTDYWEELHRQDWNMYGCTAKHITSSESPGQNLSLYTASRATILLGNTKLVYVLNCC